MRNGNKFTMNTPNTEKLGDLLSQLGAILGVGKRSDGKYHLSDMCIASSVKKWAARKPYPLVAANSNPVTDNAYTVERAYGNAYTNENMTRIGDIGSVKIEGRPNTPDVTGFYTAMGMDIPYLDNISNNLDRCEDVVDAIDNMINGVEGYNWEKSPWGRNTGEYKRIRDFAGYNHNAGFPFAYSMDMTSAYIDNGPHFYVNFVSSNDNISPATLFSTAFGGALILALVVKDPAGGLTLVTNGTSFSKSGASATVPSDLKKKYPNGSFTAYLFAYDQSKGRAIMLPCEGSQKTAKSFSVNGYLYADPFVHLDMVLVSESGNTGSEINPEYNETIKAGRSGTAWPMKTFVPTMTSRTYHALPTSSDVAMSFTVKNTMGESLPINLSKIYGRISLNTGKVLDELIPLYDANLNQLTGTISLAANESRTFYIYQTQIWSRFGITSQSTSIIRTLSISLYYNDGQYGSNPPSVYPKMGPISAMLVNTSAYNGQVAIVKNPNGYDYTITGWTSNI